MATENDDRFDPIHIEGFPHASVFKTQIRRHHPVYLSYDIMVKPHFDTRFALKKFPSFLSMQVLWNPKIDGDYEEALDDTITRLQSRYLDLCQHLNHTGNE